MEENKNIKVYHAKKPNFGFGDDQEFNDKNFELVAEGPETMDLDEAFESTQNIDYSWTLNKNITAKKQPCRSTSVGDVIVRNGKPFKCDHVGWVEIKTEENKIK